MGFVWLDQSLSRFFVAHSLLLLHYPFTFLLAPLFLTLFLSIGLLHLPNAFVKDQLELYTPTDARALRELNELDRLFHINDTDPFYASRRYDLKRSGYIVITAGGGGERRMGEEEENYGNHNNDDDDILNPKTLKAAAHLWSIIQSLAIDEPPSDGHQHRRHHQLENQQHSSPPPSAAGGTSYASLCVHLPLADSLLTLLNTQLANVSSQKKKEEEEHQQFFCVSNPLLELFKLALDQSSSSSASSSSSSNQLFHGLFDTFMNGSSSSSSSSSSSPLFANNSSEAFGHFFDQLGNGVRGLIGGISLDPETRRIAGAKALMLPYALKHGTEREEEMAQKWELKLAEFLLRFKSPVIQADWWTYETLAAESSRDRDQLKRMLLPCFLSVLVFTILLCSSRSPIHSRPLLAIGGVLAVAMAICSSLGLLLLLDFQFSSVVLSMPFIIFSIGVDNCFILLAAWRATSPTDGLEPRMAKTFADAGTSITITWLTDMTSFAVGCFTPFPSVQIFCVASTVALFFSFLYQLTFFGAIFGLTSRREVQNRHCLTMCRQKNPTKNGGHNLAFSRFFRDYFASFLLNKFVRPVVLFVFAIYLIISAFGCLNIELGLEPFDLLPDDSYGKNALRVAEKYFPDYGGNLHVWMHNLSKVHLGHRRLWLILEKEVELYEHTEFTGPADSWLPTFFRFQKAQGIFTTNENFVPRLKQFLRLGQHQKYRRDILFTTDGNWLDASRVPIRLRFVGFQNQSRAMSLFRNLAESSELPTSVYADFFLFAEQYNSLVPCTISSIAIAGISVILISLLFIPEPMAALWVSFSIFSINLGILGLMPFFSLRLDFISMVTIVMSIGFCVDFCAHLAHSFARSEGTSAQRMRNAMYAVGTPILQSASSTALGVSFLGFAESYIFHSFFKTILLVISLGVLHGLIILPVLLTIFPWQNDDEGNFIQTEDTKNGGREKMTAHIISAPIPIVPAFYNNQNRSISSFHHQQPPFFLGSEFYQVVGNVRNGKHNGNGWDGDSLYSKLSTMLASDLDASQNAIQSRRGHAQQKKRCSIKGNKPKRVN